MDDEMKREIEKAKALAAPYKKHVQLMLDILTHPDTIFAFDVIIFWKTCEPRYDILAVVETGWVHPELRK